MGPRPADFNEEEVKKAPTWRKWLSVPAGSTLRYACRDFVKGNAGDEERLMRRIMIARRNNIKDHEALKRARELAVKQQKQEKLPRNETRNDKNKVAAIAAHQYNNQYSDGRQEPSAAAEPEAVDKTEDISHQEKKRRFTTIFSDAQIAEEMDVQAVEATRSYRIWKELEDGAEFMYNQKLIKGRDEHDWLLRKNIWRRMRYRRENKKMMDEVLPEDLKPSRKKRVMKPTTEPTSAKATASRTTRKRKRRTNDLNNIHDQMLNNNQGVSTASQIVDQALLSAPTDVLAGLHANSHHHLQHMQHHHHASLESAAAEAAASIPPDPDTAAVVEAAVAAGESYAISPYVHNPMGASVDGLGLALDAAARLAAAKSAAMESDAAALAASVAEHHHPPLSQHPLSLPEQQQQPDTMVEHRTFHEQVRQDDVLDYGWGNGDEGHCM
jgi:hypothetical protein